MSQNYNMHIALPFTDLINRPKYLIEIFMNQEDLQKLKDTNSCPTGDFEGADLSGMDLRRANLSGAALKKAT
ncbi:MAG: pentapeptide repeat-containing protein [bacterium]